MEIGGDGPENDDDKEGEVEEGEGIWVMTKLEGTEDVGVALEGGELVTEKEEDEDEEEEEEMLEMEN